MKANTEIRGDIAIVRPLSGGHGQVAQALLAAAGPDRVRQVRTVTTGGRGFQVPVEIAKAAGFIPDPADEPADDPAPADDAVPAAEKTARRSGARSSRKTASPDPAGAS
ncbi:hypothetical protein NDR87_31490 [Nocardia sp. CDC159]|uniref:Uncharacterized protein n=1 Tax=Nocardia pulmonis TaxID=2951408 RepID=A0A9X2J2D7_9NOCA|nr:MULTISPECIES: hypothetical protein [Nocardia]MCM6777926.1 hypothetical protein [Nocardia pulmonis]MCM6790903.1 hypothetical protein [Nocardia sp. CDC159]